MLEHLFGSKTRLKLLKTFYREPDRPFFVRELTREIDAHINAVRRELNLLIKIGLITENEDVKNKKGSASSLRKYYSLNRECIFYMEMQSLLSKAHTAGEQELVKKIKQKAGKFKLIVVAGRLVGNDKGETDLLLVGDAKERILSKLVDDYEKSTGAEIRYTVMSEKEFYDRRYVMDRFLYTVLEGNNIKVVNDLNI
jgi:predicted transcriptional regulator